MALNAYLRLKGERSGVVTGSVNLKGREGLILVFAAEHEILSPRDLASGQATGKRQHKPFVFSKEVDRASPVLYRMLVDHETISEATFLFWTPSPAGAERQHYTVRLSNAGIAGIRFELPNTRVPDSMRLKEYEEISLVYERIVWTWNDGGVSSQDDWVAPVA